MPAWCTHYYTHMACQARFRKKFGEKLRILYLLFAGNIVTKTEGGGYCVSNGGSG